VSVYLPIMINETTIGCLQIRRTERLRNGKDDVHTYEWNLHVNGGKTLRGERGPESYSGTVEHSYGDGVVELARKVFAQLEPVRDVVCEL